MDDYDVDSDNNGNYMLSFSHITLGYGSSAVPISFTSIRKLKAKAMSKTR